MIHEHEVEHEQLELDEHIEGICSDLLKKQFEQFKVTIYQKGGGSGGITEETDPVWTADEASYSTKAVADTLYLGIGAKAADSDLLDGHDTAYFQVAGSYQADNAVLTELTALTDPAADRVVIWNDTTNNFEFLSYANWDTAYGWGNHASAGYLTSVTAHNLLSATHGDTTASAVARGDLIVGTGATPKWDNLAIGTAGKVLYSNGTDALWSDTPTLTSLTIGANTLDTNEWAFLDGQDQAVKTTSGVTFENILITKMAQASVAEQLFVFTISDDAVGKFSFRNASATDGVFLPWLEGISGGTAIPFYFTGRATTDTGSNPCIVFDGRVGESTPVATRPLVSFRNLNVEQLRFGNNGDIDLGILAKIVWGTDFGTNDTNLYRDAADILKTDDTFDYGAGIKCRGTTAAGRATLTASSSSIAVSFDAAQPDTNYSISICPPYQTSFWYTSKTVNGFTINVGTTNAYAQTIDWSITA